MEVAKYKVPFKAGGLYRFNWCQAISPYQYTSRSQALTVNSFMALRERAKFVSTQLINEVNFTKTKPLHHEVIQTGIFTSGGSIKDLRVRETKEDIFPYLALDRHSDWKLWSVVWYVAQLVSLNSWPHR
jgi:hypothetical protein